MVDPPATPWDVRDEELDESAGRADAANHPPEKNKLSLWKTWGGGSKTLFIPPLSGLEPLGAEHGHGEDAASRVAVLIRSL